MTEYGIRVNLDVLEGAVRRARNARYAADRIRAAGILSVAADAIPGAEAEARLRDLGIEIDDRVGDWVQTCEEYADILQSNIDAYRDADQTARDQILRVR